MDNIFKATIIPDGIANIAGTDMVNFSVCIDIDHDNTGFDDSKPENQTNVNEFYKRFLALSHYLSSPNGLEAHVLVNEATNPVRVKAALSNDEYWKENCQLGMLEGIRETLWQNLFSAMPLAMEEITESRVAQPIIASLDKLVTKLRADVPLQKNVTIGTIESLNDANTLYNSVKGNKDQDLVSSLIDPKRVASKVAGLINGQSQLINTLAQSTLASQKFKEVSIKNQAHFTMLNSPGLKLHAEMDMKQLHEMVSKNYIDTQIDINETFITFSQLSHHPLLLRLFGLVLDFSIPLDTVKNWGDTFTISLRRMTIPGFYVAKEWSFYSTNIAKITVTSPVNPNKYAFLPIAKDPSLFNCSILDDNKAYLLNHDPMAQEQKLTAAKEKADQGITDVIGEVHDSFTRGIIYNHPDLGKIIQPLDVKDGQIYEEHISMGTRVVIKNRHEYNGKWISLTKRSTSVYAPDNTKVYDCGDTESCIHFDQVGNYMDDQTAQIHQKTSEALFEFKGENLTLNTVFSRESMISKLESDSQQQANPPDQSTYNSQLRLNQYLDIDYFPFDKKVRPNVAKNAVKLRYSLPFGNLEALKMASLRFGQTYQFLVYNQYKNGWAIPLHSSGTQASLDDIWNKIKPQLKNPALKFRRLENSKPVILFSKNPIGKKQQESTTDLLGKDSLLHLLLRDAQTNTQVFRHVLPERIALETAFWAGLLSQMTRDERHKWKCRYNYSETLQPWQATPYDLDCSNEVAGTKMNDYYPGDVIKSTEVVYLPDPVVDGFTLQLYWDKACTEEYLIAYGNEAIFEKPNNYSVSSYGLSLMQKPSGGDSAQIAVSNDNHKAVIYLKSGMKAYAKIYNHVEDADKRETLGHDYWLNQLHGTASQIYSTDFKTLDDDPKSQALIIELTNSTRKPIFTPELWEFWSRGYEVDDDHDQDLSYIQEWIDESVALLQNPLYSCADRYGYLIDAKTKKGIFKVDHNILGIRPQDNSDDQFLTVQGSSNVTFHMAARFERLDAISINNFLPGVSPTGALELWMRKEDFIDNPTQYVLPKKAPAQGQNQADGRVNHFPDEPIYSLNDPKNKTYHDYKVDWSADTFQQLKSRLDPSTLGDYRKNYLVKTTSDPFQDTISQLVETYNAKTTKFELREYQLIDTSKYRGYYTDQKAGDVTDYQLPSTPFPVLLLGNQKPDKPSIAFLVTTIGRDAVINKDKEISATQRGSFVTVYLNRGRLSSGRDERVGVLVENGNEYSDIYVANKTISKTGKDVITDQLAPQSQFIRYDKNKVELQDIIIPQVDLNIYDARYEESLSIVSYLPKFDCDKQLWKFEIEFNLLSPQKTQLHNPFINLGFVHFQPFALDHNLVDATPDLNKNCRLSEAETTTFCYLLPERTMTATFHKPCFLEKWGTADIMISCDKSSLSYYNSKDKAKYRTNFIVCVEGSADEQIWYPIMSQSGGGPDWQLMHPLIDYDKLAVNPVNEKVSLRFLRESNPNIVGNQNSAEDHVIKYHKFRLRLVEVEWFRNETWEELVTRHKNDQQLNLLLTDVLNIEDLRVRYVELIY